MSDNNSQPRADWMTALSRAYARLVILFACTSMLLIVAIMGVQVFFRYVLNDSLIWAEEMCRYLLVLLTFLLIGAAYERGEMICLDFLIGRLPPRARLAVLLPMHVLMTVFLLLLAYYGIQFANLNSQFMVPAVDFIASALFGRQVSLGLSMYWLYMLIPAACVIMTGHFVFAMLRMAGGLLGHVDPARALPPGHNPVRPDWIS